MCVCVFVCWFAGIFCRLVVVCWGGGVCVGLGVERWVGESVVESRGRRVRAGELGVGSV